MTDYQDYNRPGYTGATPYPSADPMRVPRSTGSTGIIVALGLILIGAIALFAFSGGGDDAQTVRDSSVQSAPTATVPSPAGQAEQPAAPAIPQIAPGEQVE